MGGGGVHGGPHLRLQDIKCSTHHYTCTQDEGPELYQY